MTATHSVRDTLTHGEHPEHKEKNGLYKIKSGLPPGVSPSPHHPSPPPPAPREGQSITSSAQEARGARARQREQEGERETGRERRRGRAGESRGERTASTAKRGRRGSIVLMLPNTRHHTHHLSLRSCRLITMLVFAFCALPRHGVLPCYWHRTRSSHIRDSNKGHVWPCHSCISLRTKAGRCAVRSWDTALCPSCVRRATGAVKRLATGYSCNIGVPRVCCCSPAGCPGLR